MKSLYLPLALAISFATAAEDEWVAVGQVPTAQPAKTAADESNQAQFPTDQASTIPNTYSPAPQAPSLQAELLVMVETMQQEIAELRGTVEEQNHQIDQLKKLQQQRYLEMDRRLSVLLTQDQAAKKAAASTNDVDGQAVLPPDDLYAQAMGLIKQKKFAEALSDLDIFARNYPEHALAANAFYWSGEVQLAQKNYDVAIQQFSAVIEKHPQHGKAADSLYKLAVAHDRKGETDQAKELLAKVISQYEGQAESVVRLAKRYLERLNTPES